MQAYLWVKTFHLVFVMAWIAAAFYLPRILINLVEAGSDTTVRARLVLMGRRLYRFGHVMLGLALALGMVLWMGYTFITDFPTMAPMGGGAGWLHAKLADVGRDEAVDDAQDALVGRSARIDGIVDETAFVFEQGRKERVEVGHRRHLWS